VNNQDVRVCSSQQGHVMSRSLCEARVGHQDKCRSHW
jgi:hypothetical protein